MPGTRLPDPVRVGSLRKVGSWKPRSVQTLAPPARTACVAETLGIYFFEEEEDQATVESA